MNPTLFDTNGRAPAPAVSPTSAGVRRAGSRCPCRWVDVYLDMTRVGRYMTRDPDNLVQNIAGELRVEARRMWWKE